MARPCPYGGGCWLAEPTWGIVHYQGLVRSEQPVPDKKVVDMELLIQLLHQDANAGWQPETLWKTQDGRQIPLSQLEDSHLQNTERWLRGDGSSPRRADDRLAKDWLPAIREEMLRRVLKRLGSLWQ